ncbi:PREDICTED: uncharacterized protein LOC104704475 [Camelina sativa]|uniref:Uncharacterized protein LOC104704475 n=1 Tax=Camelina sativa TaxID=90675 RepID=A0ABM0T0E2_CAMSA|nr:PREDICTED: uncharacterized protein LOC104704475 [Camelina sativa]
MVQLQPPKTVKDIRSFLGHAGFYRRFIKDFSKIARPLTRILCKETEFNFDEDCLKAFKEIKVALISAPIVQAPNWDLPFEIMCDASDFAVGAVLGQKKIRSCMLFTMQVEPWMKLKEDIQQQRRSFLQWMRIEGEIPIDDSMPEEKLMQLEVTRPTARAGTRSGVFGHSVEQDQMEEWMALDSEDLPWYADIVNYKVCEEIPADMDPYKKKKLLKDINGYYWDESYLYKKGSDGLFRRCIAENEVEGVLGHCDGSAYGGHFATFKTAQRVLQAGLWWPTLFKDTHKFITKCDACQRIENITRRNEMPQNPILEVEIFDVWGIDFMRPFNPPSNGNVYILVAVDYVSKYGIPRVVISDGGTHFINKIFEGMLRKYGVKHKVSTTYHPQTIEVEYKVLWAIKILNLDLETAQAKRSLDLHELEEIRLEAYESSKIYKERTKVFHDKKIVIKDLKAGDQALLFNSKLKLFHGKLKSRWGGPFAIKEVLPFGAVTLLNKDGSEFTVNGQRVKK